MDELWGCIFGLIGIVVAAYILFKITVLVLMFVGFVVIVPIDFLAHGFDRLGVHDPALGWCLLGVTIGGLIGAAAGFRSAGRPDLGVAAGVALVPAMILLLVGSASGDLAPRTWRQTATPSTTSGMPTVDTTSMMAPQRPAQIVVRPAETPSEPVQSGEEPQEESQEEPQAEASNEVGVTIASTPPEALLFIDGHLVNGVTPWTGTLSPGNHLLQFQKTGYRDWKVLLDVSQGPVPLRVMVPGVGFQAYTSPEPAPDGVSHLFRAELKEEGQLPTPPVRVTKPLNTDLRGEWRGEFDSKPCVLSIGVQSSDKFVNGTITIELNSGSVSFPVAGRFDPKLRTLHLQNPQRGFTFDGSLSAVNDQERKLVGHASQAGVDLDYSWSVTQ